MSEVPRLLVPRLSATDRLVSLAPLWLRDVRTGAPPRLRTAVRVGLRGSALGVRFDGRDDSVVAALTHRDGPLWTEDVFEVFLATLDPPRTYFEFEVNPLGTLFDARVESPDLKRTSMRVDPAWTCPGLEARVRRKEGAWSAVWRIPLDSPGGIPIAARLRANFCRIDRGAADEYSAWSPTWADPPDFHVPERFGILDLSE